MDTPERKNTEIAITTPSTIVASFSNATQVNVSDDSVIIQFAYVRPNTEGGTLIAEIALTPKHAINFSRALDTTIKQHFTRHLSEIGPGPGTPPAPGSAAQDNPNPGPGSNPSRWF